MDADGLTFACAMTVEERIAAPVRAATAVVGLGASNGVPEGRLVSFGIAGALSGELAVGTVIDATRVVDESGAVLWEGEPLGRRPRATGTILGASRIVDDPAERARPACGDRRRCGRHGVGCARAERAARRLPAGDQRYADPSRSAVSPRSATPDGGRRRRRVPARLRPRACGDRAGGARCAPGAAEPGEGGMSKRVLLAAPRSFCAGVDRAIEIVERLLAEHGPPIYVRHQIVHNDHVVRRLERLGAVFVDDEDEIPAGEICVLSAHGVAPAVRESCERRGLRVVDAVCPLVSKVHAEARRYADSGHLVALVGHADHVEVIGTHGERPESTVVVESPEEAAQLESDGRPVAVISQTTLSLDDVRSTVDALEKRFGTLTRPGADDICYATQNRQDAVKRACRGGDARFS